MARSVRWDLVADPRQYQRGFKEAERTTKQFTSTLRKTTALIGGAFAGAAVISGVKSTIDAASNLNETISKTNVIFGKSAKEIRVWSQGSARSMGLSRNEALTSAAAFGDMFQQLKLGQPQAVTMSKSMVKLAADFASFHNADITQVLEAQSAAFRGEYDALQRFIPNISAARVEQVALAESHKKSAKELTAAEKAQATYSIMLKDGARAVGDFKRTSDGAANQQRIFRAEVEDMKASIGQALIGPFTAVVKLINEKVIPAFKEWVPKALATLKESLRITRDWWDKNYESVRVLIDAFSTDYTSASGQVVTANKDVRTSAEKVKDALDQLLEGSLRAAQGYQLLGFGSQIVSANALFLIKTLGYLIKGLGILTLSGTHAGDSLIEFADDGLGKAIAMAKESQRQFRQTQKEIDRLHGKDVTITARGVWVPPKGLGSLHGIVGAAGGGPIIGPGTPTSDSIPAWLSTGEHVLSAREVQGLGGHQAVAEMRRHARGFAAGGPVGDSLGLGPQIQTSINRLAAAIDRLSVRIPIQGANIPHVAGAWKLALDFLRSAGVPFNVISTFRPGARTHASGRQSYHALNRAVDLTGPNMLGIWQALSHTNPTELIYSRAPFYKSRSGWHSIGALDPITRADHFSHVHAAYKRGGRIPEDVFGVGRSGRTYGFHGGETVVPKGGGVSVTLNFSGPVIGGADAFVRELAPKIREGLKAELRRAGKVTLADQM